MHQLRPTVLRLVEVIQTTKTLGLVFLEVYQKHLLPHQIAIITTILTIVIITIILTIVILVTVALHQIVVIHLLLAANSNKTVLFESEKEMIFLHSLFSFFISWYNMYMNKYQKNIFKGTIYSLLSGLIWGICGILGEYFFAHYQVSSGWITSMRLLVAGSVVLFLSSFQLRSQLFNIWKNWKNYLPFLAYAILGIFSVQFFFYLCVEYSNATTATILQFISPIFILLYNRIIYKKKASKSAIFYVLIAMIGVFLMATKGDLSKLSITPLALITGLLSALGLMFNVILPQRFAKNYGFVPTVGWGMIIAGLFSNFLYPVYEISFQVDAISILICLTIAFLGTAFAFFLSMKAVSLVSPLVVSVVSASEPLSSAILSVLFLGMVLDGFLVLAMILIIVPMIFLSIEESKSNN